MCPHGSLTNDTLLETFVFLKCNRHLCGKTTETELIDVN